MHAHWLPSPTDDLLHHTGAGGDPHDPLAWREAILAHERADQALVEGRLDDAQRGFEQALRIAGDLPQLRYGLACVAARRAESADAMGHLKAALKLGLRDAELVRWDPDLDLARSDASYEVLLSGFDEVSEPQIDGALLELVLPKPKRWAEVAGVGRVALSPDGLRLAIPGPRGEVQLLHPTSGRELESLRAGSRRAWALAFSPDGRELAVLDLQGDLHVLPIVSKASGVVLRGCVPRSDSGELFDAQLFYSPSGDRLLVAAGRGAALVGRGGVLVRRLPERTEGALVTWLNDGQRFVYASGAERLRVARAYDGRATGRPLAFEGALTALDGHPLRPLVAVGHGDARTTLWDLEAGRARWTRTDQDFFASATRPLVFSPNGGLLARGLSTMVQVDLLDVDSGERSLLWDSRAGRAGEPAFVRFSPSGSRVWFEYVRALAGPRSFGLDFPVPGGGLDHPNSGHLLTSAVDVSLSGLAAAGAGPATILFHAERGQVLWRRVEQEGGEPLLQAPTGHFQGVPASLEGARVFTRGPGGPTALPLAQHVLTLHSPKHVRAAMAGVPLAAPRLFHFAPRGSGARRDAR